MQTYKVKNKTKLILICTDIDYHLLCKSVVCRSVLGNKVRLASAPAEPKLAG